MEYVLKIDKSNVSLNDKPIGETDILLLLSKFSDLHEDKDLRLVLDYWLMLKESGHNGFYLKSYHETTQNKSEAIRK